MNCEVTICVPLESVGAVWCDYYGNYHIQIEDKDFVTDGPTYWRIWRIINARSKLRDQTKKEEE